MENKRLYPFDEEIWDDENKRILHRFELKIGGKVYEIYEPYGNRDMVKYKEIYNKKRKCKEAGIWDKVDGYMLKEAGKEMSKKLEDFTREELLEMIKNSILEHQVANIRLVNRAREFKDANMVCAIHDAKTYMYEIVRPFYQLTSELYGNEEWVAKLKELTEDAYSGKVNESK